MSAYDGLVAGLGGFSFQLGENESTSIYRSGSIYVKRVGNNNPSIAGSAYPMGNFATFKSPVPVSSNSSLGYAELIYLPVEGLQGGIAKGVVPTDVEVIEDIRNQMNLLEKTLPNQGKFYEVKDCDWLFVSEGVVRIREASNANTSYTVERYQWVPVLKSTMFIQGFAAGTSVIVSKGASLVEPA